MGTHPGVLKRAVTRLATSAKEHEAAELQKGCVQMGAVPVRELPDRELVRVAGTLRTVTLRPRAGVPALVAELYDGSGAISLVWLGRRQIPGIEPGRALIASGRVTRDHDQPVIFNPRYELRPVGAE
jgi:OB-fold nucleic acid binding protein